MDHVIKFLNAVASLAWPAFAFVAFFYLKDEIKNLIGRLRRGKILGQEIELDDQLDNLKIAVDSVKQIASNDPARNDAQQSAAEKDQILGKALASPLETFLRISSELELAINNVLARSGWADSAQKLSVAQAFARLPRNWVADDIAKSIRQFTEIRNRIVHEHHQVTEAEILRAIDIGLDLITIVKSYPIEENRVREMVAIFEDSSCKKAISGTKGLRLDTRHPNLPNAVRIFPTTRTWYEPGQLVSWEWNSEMRYGPAWFINSETGEIEQAWHSSTEFVGRPLREKS